MTTPSIRGAYKAGDIVRVGVTTAGGTSLQFFGRVVSCGANRLYVEGEKYSLLREQHGDGRYALVASGRTEDVTDQRLTPVSSPADFVSYLTAGGANLQHSVSVQTEKQADVDLGVCSLRRTGSGFHCDSPNKYVIETSSADVVTITDLEKATENVVAVMLRAPPRVYPGPGEAPKRRDFSATDFTLLNVGRAFSVADVAKVLRGFKLAVKGGAQEGNAGDAVEYDVAVADVSSWSATIASCVRLKDSFALHLPVDCVVVNRAGELTIPTLVPAIGGGGISVCKFYWAWGKRGTLQQWADEAGMKPAVAFRKIHNMAADTAAFDDNVRVVMSCLTEQRNLIRAVLVYKEENRLGVPLRLAQ